MPNLSELIRQNAYLKSGGKSAEYKDVNDVAGEIPGDFITKAVANFIALKKGSADATKAAGENAPIADNRAKFEQLKAERQGKIDTATAPGMPPLSTEQAAVAQQYLNPPEPTGPRFTLENGTPSLDQGSKLAAMNATDALTDLRERPKSLKELTPIQVTKQMETITGGKVKEGQVITLGELNQLAGLERAETTAGGQDRRFAINSAGDLRKEFINRPEVKDFQTVKTSINSMEALLKSALAGNMENMTALDQGLITMFNKLTDPQSVVRESEYARTSGDLPLINRITGAIDKLKAGGAGLTNEDRQALVVGAKIIGNERGAAANIQRANYAKLAQEQYGIDPNIVVSTIDKFTPFQLGAVGGSAATAPQKDQFQIGQTIQRNGKTYTYEGNGIWDEK